jgi:hypothetical protein
MMPELHVLFGAIGYPLAQRLLSVGRRVPVVKQSSGRIATGSEIGGDRRADVHAYGKP